MEAQGLMQYLIATDDQEFPKGDGILYDNCVQVSS